MKKVFIVRPFGTKTTWKLETGAEKPVSATIDFDLVERELIRPAITTLGLEGGTTGEIFEAGDIREDMFTELLLADIVIADISIYNANVFYELGIRHALRDKVTILIKCRGFDETPFDIIGYKYVGYKKEQPADALAELKKTITDTVAADGKDSPVFNLLPRLESQDPEKYLALPEDFTEEVVLAAAIKDIGKLVLLASEAESFGWKLPALRLVGEALYRQKEMVPARSVWEKIKQTKKNDVTANDRLATIYQRLAENEIAFNPQEGIKLLKQSDLAIAKLIADNTLPPAQRAENYALKARNEKTRWLAAWKGLPPGQQCEAALSSPFLVSTFKLYLSGFNEDLNHFYSGLNALGLLLTILSLADRFPETWKLSYESDAEAAEQLKTFRSQYPALEATVQASIAAAKIKLDRTGQIDHWVHISDADLFCLTGCEPPRIAKKYRDILATAGELNTDAIVRQLQIYATLGVKNDNVKAALDVMAPLSDQLRKVRRRLLFTGHMIDKMDRKEPRFPASCEATARRWIKEKVLEEQGKLAENETLEGIAGGACGGDILFHEVCMELGIPTTVYLALPPAQFKVESVAFAGNGWIDRFDNLLKKRPHPVLANEGTDLPNWLRKRADYNIWERNNQWLLQTALTGGGEHMTLIALWNGEKGDGAGGTEHLVREARKQGAKTEIIDSNKLIIPI